MAKWVKAPTSEVEAVEPGPLDTVMGWLAGLGLETGLAGAALIGVGAVFLLVGLVRFWLVLRARLVERHAEGRVVETEPAEGAGFVPVVEYTDATGRKRRFVPPIATATDPTGMRMRLRIDGPRPVIVPPPPSPAREAFGMVLPLGLGALAAVSGVTGRLAGLVPIPGL